MSALALQARKSHNEPRREFRCRHRIFRCHSVRVGDVDKSCLAKLIWGFMVVVRAWQHNHTRLVCFVCYQKHEHSSEITSHPTCDLEFCLVDAMSFFLLWDNPLATSRRIGMGKCVLRTSIFEWISTRTVNNWIRLLSFLFEISEATLTKQKKNKC